MCFVLIGMLEVFINEIIVKEGQRVKKGDQFGMFYFGGFIYLLIFCFEVDIYFDLG